MMFSSLIPRLVYGNKAGWFSMSPLPRLHHHDIMAIVELFFMDVPFVTIRHVMLVRSKTVQCTTVVSSRSNG